MALHFVSEPNRTWRERLGAAWSSFQAPAQTPPPQMGIVSVADRYALFGGAPSRYNPDVLISRKGYRVIDTMRRDEQIKAAMSFKKHSVIAAGWSIKVPTGMPEDWEPKVFIKDMLDDLDGTLEQSLLEIMLALDYGVSITEKVWEEEDGKIRLTQLLTRRPHDIILVANPVGELVDIVQSGISMPVDKFIVYSYGKEFSNHYGTSDLGAAYRAWWTKDNAYKWMAMLLERLGIPPVFALYNPTDYTAPSLQSLQNVMENLQAATTGTIPKPNKDSLEMWAPELAGQVSSVFVPSMEMFNKDIARALLMPGLIGMSDDTTRGSLARSRVHFDVFMMVLMHLRKELAERVINEQIVQPALAYNYPITDRSEMPWFEWEPVTEDDKATLFNAWTNLVTGGVVNTQDEDEEHVRSSMGFPEFDDKAQQARADRERLLNPPPVIAPKVGPDGNPVPAGGIPPGTGPTPPAQAHSLEQHALSDEQLDLVLKRMGL